MSRIARYVPLRRWVRNEDGATAVEYAMLIALIAFVLMGALAVLADGGGAFGDVSGAVVNSPGQVNDGGDDGGDGGGNDGGGATGDNNGMGDGSGGGQGPND